MEREKFEQSWKHAFEDAEITPSEKVWTRIELDLEKSQGGELKRRLMFYQMLAAASVVLAMTVGGVGYFYSFRNQPASPVIAQHGIHPAEESVSATDESVQPQKSETASVQGSTPADNAVTDNAVTDKASTSIDQPSIADNTESRWQQGKSTPHEVSRQSNETTGSIAAYSAVHSENMITRKASALSIADRGTDDPVLPREIKDGQLPPLYSPRDVKLNFEQDEPDVDPVVAMLAMLEQREREVQDEDDRKKSENMKNENLWTSIGFAAGSFNAVQAPSASNGSGSVSTMALAAPIVDQESKASGYSYSMGINVGTRISERWVLQGGVNYLTQSSEYTANSLVADGPGFLSAERFKPMTTNDVVNAKEHELVNRVVYSAPYNVNNSMRYLSIPMQAGYLLVNKTFGLQLNAGVATDLFLRNTVEGEGDQLASATQSGGSDSPYRTVNLSGLVGTEFSYRFGPHYRISLNPGLRYPLNTIYKSELGVQSSPLTFDVGLRFRYIFH